MSQFPSRNIGTVKTGVAQPQVTTTPATDSARLLGAAKSSTADGINRWAQQAIFIDGKVNAVTAMGGRIVSQVNFENDVYAAMSQAAGPDSICRAVSSTLWMHSRSGLEHTRSAVCRGIRRSRHSRAPLRAHAEYTLAPGRWSLPRNRRPGRNQSGRSHPSASRSDGNGHERRKPVRHRLCAVVLTKDDYMAVVGDVDRCPGKWAGPIVCASVRSCRAGSGGHL